MVRGAIATILVDDLFSIESRAMLEYCAGIDAAVLLVDPWRLKKYLHHG